ncbi:MAG: nucleotidyltransferase domain-containing protein [Verrucomicrobia bacterium]|nr:nucleotidyltransferase domain-containing protein [Verrucomicrobiota bacterium]
MPPLPPELPSVIQAIARDYQPRQIILFGSYARGNADPKHSDVDLLVVKDGVQSNRLESARIRRLIRRWIGPFAFTILPISPKRLQERLAQKEAFFQTILQEGVVLYGEN